MRNALSSSSAILQVLLDGPATGPELVERLISRHPDYSAYALSTVYAALTPMKRDGLVVDRAAPHDGGRGRPPRMFELTDLGRQQADADLREVAGVFGERLSAALMSGSGGLTTPGEDAPDRSR